MKLKYLLAALSCLILAPLSNADAYSGAGRSFSSGGYSRSYSSPSRSYSTPRTIVHNNTTVIHRGGGYYGGGYGGNGLVTGMMLGTMMNHPAPVVVAPQAPMYAQPQEVVQGQPPVIVEQEHHGFFHGLLMVLGFCTFIGILIWFVRKLLED